MPTKKSADLMPVVIQKSLTITGGYSKKPWVLMTQAIQFETGVIDCAAVAVTESWVSDLAAGQSVCKRALARVTVLKKIKDALLEIADDVEPGEDSMLAALSYADADDELQTPTPQKSPAKRRREASASVEKHKKIRAKTVVMPTSPSHNTATTEVRAAMISGQKVWVAVDDLPWLIGYMAEERATAGVPLLPSPEKKKSDTSYISWNFRDCAWQARAKAPDGTWHTHTKFAPRKAVKPDDRLYEKSWAEAKNIVFGEMQEWQVAVESGRDTARS